MSDHARDGGYDEWLDAVADGDPFYLACPEGHGWLPPRRICPDCGATDLTETPWPAETHIESHSAVHVATPAFVEDTPYVTAVATAGPVGITGVVRGVDPDDVAVGDRVALGVGERATTGDRLVVLDPVDERS